MTDSSTENKQIDKAEAEKKQLEQPKHKSRSVLLIIGLGLGAIALLSFAYFWWRHNSTHKYTNDASVINHIHPVNPRISGKVAEVLVDDNQIVTKGQPLVKLDPRDYQVQLQQAEANLKAAEKQAQVAQANIALAAKQARAQNTQASGEIDAALASLVNSEAAVAAAKANIPEAKAQLASIEADIQKTKADYARYQFLYDQGVTSAQQLDSARTAYEKDVASKEVAIKKIKQAQKQYEENRDSVASA